MWQVLFLCPNGGDKNFSKKSKLNFPFSEKSQQLKVEGKTSRTLTTEYTFNKYIPERSRKLSRMKVRQEPPALLGYHGKQGGQRFRTVLKYPIATDTAMKRVRDNDTSFLHKAHETNRKHSKAGF